MKLLCGFICFTLPAVRSNVFIPMLQIRELRFSEVKSLALKYCYHSSFDRGGIPVQVCRI